MNALTLLALLAAAAGLLPQAQAQGVWRCGADGRQFSDRPCSDGQPRVNDKPYSDINLVVAGSKVLGDNFAADKRTSLHLINQRDIL